MAKVYMSNAFSFNMLLPEHKKGIVKWEVIPAEKVAEELGSDFVNCCGHTTELINAMTGLNLSMNRISNKLNPDDKIIIAQYSGPRLPEGATELPENATLVFLKVTVE